MTRRAVSVLAMLVVAAFGARPVQAQGVTQALAQSGLPVGGLTASRLCRPAIDMAERRHGIPPRLLHAIGRVESGRADPVTGQVSPWPWTANAEGQGFYFDSKAQAIAAVNAMRARGVRSIDVGCMQVNLMHHPDAFASLEQAFDPVANADYAARYLRQLQAQTGAWPKAAALYHSATPALGDAYQKRVMAVWPEEQRLAPGGGALATAWGSTMSTGYAPRPDAFGRVLPGPGMATGQGMTGRTLDSYRSAPISWAYRVPSALEPAPAGQGVVTRKPSGHFLR